MLSWYRRHWAWFMFPDDYKSLEESEDSGKYHQNIRTCVNDALCSEKALVLFMTQIYANTWGLAWLETLNWSVKCYAHHPSIYLSSLSQAPPVGSYWQRPEQNVVHGAGSVTRPRVPSYRRQHRLDVCPLRCTRAAERRQTDGGLSPASPISGFIHADILEPLSEQSLSNLAIWTGKKNSSLCRDLNLIVVFSQLMTRSCQPADRFTGRLPACCAA